MVEITHLEKAQHGLKSFSESTSNNAKYLEGILRRVEVEALVSVAEELTKLNKLLTER